MRFSRFVILGFLLALSVGYSRAQDPYYTSLNKSVGLPSNSVYDIFQDSKGFMWIACGEGLCRFDGFEFKTYVNRHQSSLSGNCIGEDKYGRIWYKNFDGYVFYVENDSLRSLTQNNAIANGGCAILGDHILVQQKTGVDIYSLKTLQIIKTVPINEVSVVSQVSYKGYFWLLTMSTGKRAVLYRISTDGTVEKQDAPLGGYLSYGKRGVVIFQKMNAQDRCYELVGKNSWQKLPTPPGAFVHNLQFCDNKYWLLTPSGAWVYDTAGNVLNSGQPYYSEKSPSALLKDREGNFWVGTLDNGILFVPDINVRLVTTPGFSPNLLQAANGKLYIGTKDNSIYTYDLAAGKFDLKFKGDIYHEVVAMLADSVRNTVYFASTGFASADLAFKHITKYSFALKSIDVVDDKYCAIAASGVSGLLKVSDKGTSKWDSIYTSTKRVEDSNLCSFLGNNRGRSVVYNPVSDAIYFASNKGLHVATPHGITEVKTGQEPIFARKLVYYKGVVYALTPQHVIYAVVAGSEPRIVSLGDQSGAILNIAKAGGTAYVITTTGIHYLDPARTHNAGCAFRSGVPAKEINAFEVVNGAMVVASDQGLVIGKETRRNEEAAPGFVINRVLVNGEPRSGNSLKLKFQENDVDILYSVLFFGIYNDYQLYYKINDGDWELSPATTRDLKLASLSPGRYNIAFELRSEAGKRYQFQPFVFSINNPFWAEWWFWACCVVAISITGFTYHSWQARVRQRENALQMEKLELEKNLRHSMLTSLKAQMNPHFFYNALNTIQSFIFSDDKRNASTYLVKLSKLTRTILEMSEKDTISLEEEAAALKLYLELEKVRFNEDFEYDLKLGKNVDSELVSIPPMIVQPYVENAIKHGLLHKKGDKKLSVEFDKLNDKLCVTIDDNGVGRAKAIAIAKTRFEKHLSFSSSANNKRIELLNKGKNRNIGVAYIDKTSPEGLPAGTTVVISIPLN